MTRNNVHAIIDTLPWNITMSVLRLAKKWSISEAAKRCSTNYRTYWSWETGKNKPIKVNRQIISNVYGIPENELFGEEGG